MKHLFKLKKDGKTVGYEKRAQYRPSDDNLVIFSSFNGIEWFENELTNGYNSAHPFVATDKNGKDVFEGDEIVSNKDDPILEVKGVVKYRSRFADYIIEGTQRYGIKNTDIELIEDEK